MDVLDDILEKILAFLCLTLQGREIILSGHPLLHVLSLYLFPSASVTHESDVVAPLKFDV